MDLEAIKKLHINESCKSSNLIDVSFWILGELSLNLNSSGKIDVFQILPKTKNVLFKLPEGNYIQRISETFLNLLLHHILCHQRLIPKKLSITP